MDQLIPFMHSIGISHTGRALEAALTCLLFLIPLQAASQPNSIPILPFYVVSDSITIISIVIETCSVLYLTVLFPDWLSTWSFHVGRWKGREMCSPSFRHSTSACEGAGSFKKRALPPNLTTEVLT